MAAKALVTVAGYTFPEPSTYKTSQQTLVDGARNIKGKMIGAVIRDDVTKVEMSWSFITPSQWAKINACFRKSSGGKFINTVTYYDQEHNLWRTKTMYVGDRATGGMFTRHKGSPQGFKDASIHLIEV